MKRQFSIQKVKSQKSCSSDLNTDDAKVCKAYFPRVHYFYRWEMLESVPSKGGERCAAANTARQQNAH